MPLPVPPGSGLGAPVTSSDGYLTCTPDSSRASVLIRVNFHGVTGGTPDRVTVTRTIGGVSRPVRGLDYYTSPGAVTAGLDHYAPLGQTATYQAVAANSITGQTWTSTAVTVSTPSAALRRGWVKSLVRPALSLNCVVQAWPDWEYAVPQGVFTPLNAKYPTISKGTRQAGVGQVTLGTVTAAEIAGLRALFDLDGPLLLQAEQIHGALRPDVYVEAGDLSMSTPTQQHPWRRWSFPVTEIAEPATRGVQVAVPGHTFGDSATRWPLLSNRAGTFLDRLTT